MKYLIPILPALVLGVSCAPPAIPVPTISKPAAVPAVRVVASPRIEIPSARKETGRLREALAKGDPVETGRAVDSVVTRVVEIETAARIANQAKDALELELIATREQIPAIQQESREDIAAAQRSLDAAKTNEANANARATTAEKANGGLRKWAWAGGAAGAAGLLVFLASLFRR